MITLAESGHSPAVYAKLREANAHPQYRVTAYRWNPVFTEGATGQGSSTGVVDVAVWNNTWYRLVGTQLERYSASGWNVVATFTDGKTLCCITAAETLTVYAIEQEGIYKRVSTDGVTWSAWTTVCTVALTGHVTHLVAASDQVLYGVFQERTIEAIGLNGQLFYDTLANHLFRLENGVLTWQQMEWHTLPDSLAATTLNGIEYLFMTSDTPGNYVVKSTNGTTSYHLERSQSVLGFRRLPNATLSDAVDIETIDTYTDWRFRRHVTCAVINDQLWVTVLQRDGSKHYADTYYQTYTSRDGLHWSLGKPLNIWATEQACHVRAHQQQIYALTHTRLFTAPATLQYGTPHPDTVLDISDYVSGLSLDAADMTGVNLAIDNADSTFDNHPILNPSSEIALRVEAGYSFAAVSARYGSGRYGQSWYGNQTTAYQALGWFEVDQFQQQRTLPERVVQITARDRLSWVNDKVKARNPKDYRGFLYGVDTYQGYLNSAYGDLRHTATQTGDWTTDGSGLRVTTQATEGIAFSTFAYEQWNGEHQAQFTMQDTNTNQVGVTSGVLLNGQVYQGAFLQSNPLYPAAGTRYEWKGFLQPRGTGTYRFTFVLRGQMTCVVNGQTLIAQTGPTHYNVPSTQWKERPLHASLYLEPAGVIPFTITYVANSPHVDGNVFAMSWTPPTLTGLTPIVFNNETMSYHLRYDTDLWCYAALDVNAPRYAGLVFRATSAHHLWMAVYDVGTDKVLLYKRMPKKTTRVTSGVTEIVDDHDDTLMASSVTLGWRAQMTRQRHLRVRYRYQRVQVFTDNTLLIDYRLPPLTAITPDANGLVSLEHYPAERGYVGFVGRGP